MVPPAKPARRPGRRPPLQQSAHAANEASGKRASAKGAATRRHIIAIATALFTKQGYNTTSIETVLEKSGASRGALYHHFNSKEALYAAVLEAVEARIAETTAEASRHLRDPREALRAGCNAFIGLARDTTVRQIVLLDAPAVVGWQKWRGIDARFGFGQLKAGLTNAAKAGRIRPELVDTMSHILLAALLEVALLIAQAKDPRDAMRRGRAAIDELLGALLSGHK
jgi:AcrR family transcriptional regulator